MTKTPDEKLRVSFSPRYQRWVLEEWDARFLLWRTLLVSTDEQQLRRALKRMKQRKQPRSPS